MLDIEFEPEGPFKGVFKYGIRRIKNNESPAIIALYRSGGDFPVLYDERRYNECLKAGKILTLHEYDAILRGDDVIHMTPMQSILKNEEPVPPGHHARLAGHHWLDHYDIDGHFIKRVVLQWNPSARRWSHSGNVGSMLYIDTAGWKYVCKCDIPE